MISVCAPAKVNLYLHVTGKRSDGYHLLDSLFMFARDGDMIKVENADALSLEIRGAYGAVLRADDDNLVLKAARALAQRLGIQPKARIVLEKELPVASGIGGGSADAAATLKALSTLWGKVLPPDELADLAVGLGADVPSCLAGKAVQVSGIGECLTPAPYLPSLPVLLVNPNKPVSTPAVFKSRAPVFTPSMPFDHDVADVRSFAAELRKRRNDLTEAACMLEPAVADVLRALESCDSCALARMSGSGGTCFGVFETRASAQECEYALKICHSGWWFMNTVLM